MNPETPELVQASSHQQILELQREVILSLGKRLGRPLSILEAGCGQRWLVDLKGMEYTLTGVDLDPAALEIRKTKTRDLDVAICGDLCTVDLPEASYDIVYSFYVLEHVPRADLALDNFIKWLKPGGLLLLRLPDPGTVRGFFTRILPHRAHVWYHRYVLEKKEAGLPGYPPYPTYYHPVIYRKELYNYFRARGVECFGCYGDGFRREGKNKIKRTAMRWFSLAVTALTLGRLNGTYADAMYFAVKLPKD
jgi:SAM-dependent methyltransferase